MHKMTLKQKIFCEKYIETGCNATQAAIAAGYSPKTARRIGYENLTKVYIKEEVSKRIKEVLNDTEKLTYEWLKQVKGIMTFDLRKAATWKGNSVNLKPSDELDDITALAIQEVSQSDTANGTNIKIKAADKNKALELMGKYLAILSEHPPTEEEANSITFKTAKERNERIAELLRKMNETNGK
jgi:phage terminase small subunit